MWSAKNADRRRVVLALGFLLGTLLMGLKSGIELSGWITLLVIDVMALIITLIILVFYPELDKDRKGK